MAISDAMAGVQLTGHGGPEKLVWNEAIPVPRPGPGEALVKVSAAGVNNTDINTRVGWYAKEDADEDGGGWAGALPFPLIQGGDLCGKVVALGPNAGNITIGMRVTCATNQPTPGAQATRGNRVIGSEFDGAFAQYCLVPAHQLYDVTASPLTNIEIAALPCAHGTAMNLVSRSGVGADAVLDRDATPLAGAFTVVIDLVGGPAWTGFIEALEPGGRYAISGAIAGPMVEADLRTIYLNDLTFFGCTYTPADVFAELVTLINDGRIKPLVSKTYDLADIATAQMDFAAKTYPGKLVLIPPCV